MFYSLGKIIVDKYLGNIIFTNRKYKCEIISHSFNSFYCILNKFRPIVFHNGVKESANHLTAVFLSGIPDFFYTKKFFMINNGIFLLYSDELRLEKEISNSYYLKDIQYKEINLDNIQLLFQFIKSRSFDFEENGSFYLRKMSDCFKNNDPERFYNTLCSFSGMGYGLTPASDDFIMGVILILKIFLNSKFLAENWEIPFKNIYYSVSKKTNIFSAYYIFLCLIGVLGKWQYDILKTFENSGLFDFDYIEKLKFGHSSKYDFLYGVYFALKLLFNN